MKQRLLFLCAQSSVRSRMAESIFSVTAGAQCDVWSSPVHVPYTFNLVQDVLQEKNIALLEPAQIAETIQGQRWDEVVILCSGAADF
jgi:protein-tyrosine-phosphatase